MIANGLSQNIANGFLAFPAISERQVDRSLSASSIVPNTSNTISSDKKSLFTPVSAAPPGQKTDLNIADSERSTVEQQRLEDERIEREVQEQQQLRDQRIISELAARDREVRAHEQAHAAVGGQYAGAPSYEYQRGPDGVNYAVGGEVSIDIGRAATPEATIQKAQIVRRAALAPAEPSPQDRNVAAQASRLEAQARAELVAEQVEAAAQQEQESPDAADSSAGNPNQSSPNSSEQDNSDALIRGQSDGGASSPEASNVISSISSRVSQTIANTQIDPKQPGALLNQIA